ncbi:hypothetical protein [Phytoactinopolyspora halotolerans]|nr:hypothetical protein [Phytoactinopolyspora halotolerans]
MLRVLVVAAALVLVGCSSESESGSAETGASPPEHSTDDSLQDVQRYPDVIDVRVESSGGTYSFEVTVSSPYDTPERYADGWRVVGPDGTVYGEHTLAHDHANEQPFTRTQSGVDVPDDVDEVTIEGRDSEYGYGGSTMTVPLPDG